MADPTTAMMIVAGAKALGETALGFNIETEKENQINLQAEQQRLQYQQKTLANYDLTNKILDRQLVEASAKGVSLGSPSLEALQRNTLNVGAKKELNLETEEGIFERNIRVERENVENTMTAQLLGNLTDFGMSLVKADKAKLSKET